MSVADYNLYDHLMLISIYQAVKTLYPMYTGPWPNPQTIELAAKTNGIHAMESPLRDSLVQGLGDKRCVLNGVSTKLGHFIGKLP